MSADPTHGGSPVGRFSDDVMENVIEVENHLQQLVSDGNGVIYRKAGRIGEELGMSSQQVGLYLSEIQSRDNDLIVERWGCVTTSSQWQIAAESK